MILAGVGTTFAYEYKSAGFARSAELEMIRLLSDTSETIDIPFSLRGKREVFEACAALQSSIMLSIQTSETRSNVAARCLELAEAALKRNPTLSAAHVIKASYEADLSEAANAITASWETAPRDGWEAQLRLLRGFELQALGVTAADRVIEADIVTLLQSQSGRVWLAQLYWNDPTVQPALIRIIETRPDREQAAFLTQVRRNAR